MKAQRRESRKRESIKVLNAFALSVLRVFIFFFLAFAFSVSAQDDSSPIKILAIGNSFSVDALESYFSDLAIAADIPIRVGNLFIAGASLEKHWNCVKNNRADYDYTKINEEGEKETIKKTSLLTALTEEDWDYISFQQASSHSGIYDSFFPYLKNLLEYVRSNVQSPDVKYILHLTWAYEASSRHPGFANYKNDTAVMYEAIKKTYFRIAESMNFDSVVPTGIAIQEVRQATNENLCRDGFHLADGLGCYTASCTWFEALTGQTVVGNPFFPKEIITEEQARIAQEAAQKAVQVYRSLRKN